MDLKVSAPANPKKALTDVAHEQIARMIVTGALRPGEVILEAPLARQLGISRTPLREALRRLEGEGLLTRDEAGRLSVHAFGLQDLLETLHLRIVLETETVRLAAASIDRAALKKLRGRIERVLKSSRITSEAQGEVDYDLHKAIALASGNRLIASILEDQHRKTALFSIRYNEERLTAACEEHLTIIDALLAGDADAAVTAMQVHLNAVRQFVIATLTRLGGA